MTFLQNMGLILETTKNNIYYITRNTKLNPNKYFNMFENSYDYIYDNVAMNVFNNMFINHYSMCYMHSSSEIKFKIRGLNEDNLYKLSHILLHVINQFPDSSNTLSVKDLSSISRFKLEDPVLYNVKDYVYSKACQSKNRPAMYTENEYNSLSKSEIQKKKIVKYWNFTKNKPAYYSCEGNGNLNFLTNSHPKGYCIPCCSKLSASMSARKNKIFNTCLKTHIGPKSDTRNRRYVMNYGKSIQSKRISHIPESMKDLIFPGTTKFNEESYYIYGLPQNFHGRKLGMLYCLSIMFGIPFQDIKKTIFVVKEIVTTYFNKILNGDVFEHFKSPDEIISAIFTGSGSTVVLNKILMDIPQYKNISVLLLRDMTLTYGSQSSVGDVEFVPKRNIKLDCKTHTYSVILQKRDEYYPIFYLHPNDYIANGTIKKTSFDLSDRIVFSLLDLKSKVEKSATEKTFTIDGLRTFCSRFKYKIVTIFCSLHGIYYGVVLAIGRQYAYVPINMSDVKDEPKTFGVYDRSLNISSKTQMIVTTKLNKFLKSLDLPPIIYSQQVIKGKKLIGLLVNGGSPAMPIFVPIDSGGIVAGIPKKFTTFDFLSVNRAVYNNEKPAHFKKCKQITNLKKDLYMYDDFKLTFYKYWMSKKNNNMRKKLKPMIKHGNLGKFENTLSEKDIQLFMRISEYYMMNGDKKTTDKMFDNTFFDFDMFELPTSKANILSLVRKLTPKINPTVNGTKRFPNYALDSLIKAYANDLHNPLTKIVLLAGIGESRLLSKLKFKIEDSETIYII